MARPSEFQGIQGSEVHTVGYSDFLQPSRLMPSDCAKCLDRSVRELDTPVLISYFLSWLWPIITQRFAQLVTLKQAGTTAEERTRHVESA